MLLFIIILLIISFNGVKFAEENSFHDDYLSLTNTTAINGIFVILVFLSHSSQYISLDNGILDSTYVTFKSYLAQMVVVPFLFFSGYGTMESIKNKKKYVDKIPKNKFLKTLVHFDIAILAFLIIQWVCGKTYDIQHIFLSLFGWASVGNSNWYIFAILFLYLAVFIAFKITGSETNVRQSIGSLLTLVMVVIYMYVMVQAGMPTRFYNTIMLFPIGMIYALIKAHIHKFVMRSDLCYVCTCVLILGIYFVAYQLRGSIVFYTIWGIAFMALLLLFMMKVKVENAFLLWFGKNIFGIYILQRIPMIILSNLAGGEIHRQYAFVIICLLITICLTMISDILFKKVDQVLFNKRSVKAED